MIDRETIEKLIQLMVDHDLVELDVEDGDQSIKLKRAGAYAVAAHAAHAASPLASSAHHHHHHAAPLSGGHHGSSPAPASTGAAPAGRSGGGGGGGAATTDAVFIKSPMVGTYYSKPDPDSDAFVSVGTTVSESTVVCLVEAMKVFNEIKAERSGRVVEVLVKDGDPVEYGQPLFRLEV